MVVQNLKGSIELQWLFSSSRSHVNLDNRPSLWKGHMYSLLCLVESASGFFLYLPKYLKHTKSSTVSHILNVFLSQDFPTALSNLLGPAPPPPATPAWDLMLPPHSVGRFTSLKTGTNWAVLLCTCLFLRPLTWVLMKHATKLSSDPTHRHLLEILSVLWASQNIQKVRALNHPASTSVSAVVWLFQYWTL